MDQVDFILVGSEAVVESGGLINAVGCNQMAIVAKAANKPFYALAERLVLCMFYAKTQLICFSAAINFIVFSLYLSMTSRPIIRTFYLSLPFKMGLRAIPPPELLPVCHLQLSTETLIPAKRRLQPPKER